MPLACSMAEFIPKNHRKEGRKRGGEGRREGGRRWGEKRRGKRERRERKEKGKLKGRVEETLTTMWSISKITLTTVSDGQSAKA